jgi:hypothetical protein
VSSVGDEAAGWRAREALSRHAWREAYDVMTEADRAGDLTPDDLEVLAQAAWWARVGALADGDEILTTAETAALAATRPVTGLRSVTLKGFASPVDVVSVQWG